jgi:hypothetical protein
MTRDQGGPGSIGTGVNDESAGRHLLHTPKAWRRSTWGRHGSIVMARLA